MFYQLDNVLNSAELNRLQALSRTIRFVDGRVTNQTIGEKQNLQVAQDDPKVGEPGQIIQGALFRHAEFAQIAFPKTVARPTLSRYDVGMKYGRHCDAALFPSTPPMRSDLSCTVFISEPDDYDGGELLMHMGTEEVAIKLAAGNAILYPTDAIHEVKEVTRGQRLVGITWIHSRIADVRQREIMVRLHKLVRNQWPEADGETRLDFDYVRNGLLRMWTGD